MFDYRIKAGKPVQPGVTRSGKDINFAVAVKDGKECSLLLYRKGSKEIAAELPFTEEMRFGDLYTMEICRLPAEEYEYNYRIGGEVVLDPYARKISGREQWGSCPDSPHEIRGAIISDHFSWRGDHPLSLPYEECILYVTHPRGFTKDASSRVRHPGTFAGIREKIPYLKKLGINQLELMPVYEFQELEREKSTGKPVPVRKKGKDQLNYWGYGDACFFAPKASYSASGDPVRELKELVRELHRSGIELILEFYFPERTSPGLILDCVKYWVSEYHIDGIHMNSQGVLLPLLAGDPLLARTKIMSENFPLEQIYEPGYEPAWRNLAEYNDEFLIRARRFLRGDEGMLWQITESIRKNPVQCASVNYMAGHNGFTLMDAVSYDIKHNEANGEGNRDGSNYNYSCNYGEEGPASGRALERLRRRQLRNAFLLMLLSQGVPAIYGGDEMGNSQKGNNNAYCQDNEISWLQWSRRKADIRLQRFVSEAIAFRRGCPAFGRRKEYVMKDYLSKGIPDMSWHGEKAWYGEFENHNRQFGVLYAGCYTGGDTCYVLYNMHMVEHALALPILPPDRRWYVTADTGREEDVFYKEGAKPLSKDQKTIQVPPRTILILAGR